MIGFGFLTFKEYERENKQLAFIYGALAILFQPIFKISLGRDIWNIVDVVVAIGLIVTLLKKSNK